MPQWFDPMTETHEGRLLAQVLALEKQLKGEEKLDERKADRNKDGEISSWERKVGEAIEANMQGKGKDDKQASEKTQYMCEKCGVTQVEGVSPRGLCWKCNLGTHGGKVKKEEEKTLCGRCQIAQALGGIGGGSSPSMHRRGMGSCPPHCINADRSLKGFDTTSQILSDMGIVKYEVEGNLQNGVPQFMDVAGGEPTRATVYSTNHRVPQITDGPSKTTVSEVFKMPSVSQTGYDASSSSLHMHLNDGGNSGNPPNRAPIEETLASLKKSIGVGQMGIAEEITSLLEQVYSRL